MEDGGKETETGDELILAQWDYSASPLDIPLDYLAYHSYYKCLQKVTENCKRPFAPVYIACEAGTC